MKSGKIIVVGSSNMDMVVQSDHIPVPGETILSDLFFMNPGGKGANQAVAVARLGGNVIFITRLGNDLFGQQFSQVFEREGIDARYVVFDEQTHSGIALITVDKKGENSIVVAPGANAQLTVNDIGQALKEIDNAEIVLLQLEIPMETVEYIVRYASDKNVKVILNPAPASVLTAELLSKIDILTPNETEAGMIAGIKVTDIESAGKAAKVICDLGVKTVVITMGPLGALICEEGRVTMKEATKVDPVDTTAAGDVFSGALAVALAEGKNIESAVEFGCGAAAISVTRAGAQSSIPRRDEILSLNKTKKT